MRDCECGSTQWDIEIERVSDINVDALITCIACGFKIIKRVCVFDKK